MDERMQAVEKKDRFLERRDRIIARLLRNDRDGFLERLREAEFAILALDADRGIRMLEELFRVDRSNVELGFYLGRDALFRRATSSGRPATSRKSSRSSRTTSNRSSTRASPASESGETVRGRGVS